MLSKSVRSALFALAASSSFASVSAAPIRRQAEPANPTDLLVLTFADVLNQLEEQFYTQAISKFQASDFTNAGFSSATLVTQQLTQVQSDESSHITALEALLTANGGTPVNSCTFDFSSVLTDVPTTMTVARLVENVGVGAFLGAAHLISDPTILTAAASIVTVEGRHQTMLNIFEGGAAIPNAFDLPLLPNEVLAIAGPFISNCSLGVQANTPLTITNTAAVSVGTQLTFDSTAITNGVDSLFCQMLAGGMPLSLSQPANNCVVPNTITGPVAVWLTSDDQPLNNNARDRTNITTVAGPAMLFVDTTTDTIDTLVRTSSGSPSSSSSSSSGSSSGDNSASGSAANGTTTGAMTPVFTQIPAAQVSQIASSVMAGLAAGPTAAPVAAASPAASASPLSASAVSAVAPAAAASSAVASGAAAAPPAVTQIPAAELSSIQAAATATISAAAGAGAVTSAVTAAAPTAVVSDIPAPVLSSIAVGAAAAATSAVVAAAPVVSEIPVPATSS